MALYLGETVRITARPVDPVTKEALNPAPDSATVDFWAPGKLPKTDLTDRGNIDLAAVAMAYSVPDDWFEVYQPTTAGLWVAGRWTYRVTVVGTYQNWEYGTFRLQQ